jgi:trimeric autotransporter adhesin
VNRTYKVVWSQAQGKWVAVSEVARTRGKGTSRSVVVAASAAAALAGGSAHGAPSNSFASGVFDSNNFTNCFTSVADGPSDASTCDSGGKSGAGFIAFDAGGVAGAYAIATDENTIKIGTAGSDKLTIVTVPGVTGTTINAFATLNMNGRIVTGLDNGAISNVSTDAINGQQLYTISSSMSAGISTVGSRVNSL